MNVVKLVNNAKKGNKNALLNLVMSEKDAFYRLAYTYMKNEQDSLDALSDMIVILYEKIDQLQKPESFYSWSKTILVNQCKTLLKNKQKVVFVDDYIAVNELQNVDGLKDHCFHQSERKMDLNVMLASLNSEQREAIQLKYFHDLNYETIAQIMNVSIGTVKSRIHYGMKKLQERYGGGQDE